MLFLAVLGGAAVLEVHRALHNGNGDVKELREREAALRRQLQVGEETGSCRGLAGRGARALFGGSLGGGCPQAQASHLIWR